LRILVVGATGGLGRDIVAEALAVGHETAALVRDPVRATVPQAIEIVLDPSLLTAALRERDALIDPRGRWGRLGHVVRADLARFVVARVTTNTDVRQAVTVGS
jgi:putative NADH-flavin reductase